MPNAAETVEAPYTAAERLTFLPQPARTMYHLKQLFLLLGEREMQIRLPFLWKTKTDTLALLSAGQHPELIPSSVSCSKTFQNLGQATHCGGCSQCVDRRFAAYAAKADDIDGSGIYANDIISSAISDREVKTTVLDYVRQARNFCRWNDDHFFTELATELSDVVEYLPDGGTEFERLRLAGCGKTLLSTQGRKLSDDKRRPIACSERIIRIGLSHAECRRDS